MKPECFLPHELGQEELPTLFCIGRIAIDKEKQVAAILPILYQESVYVECDTANSDVANLFESWVLQILAQNPNRHEFFVYTPRLNESLKTLEATAEIYGIHAQKSPLNFLRNHDELEKVIEKLKNLALQRKQRLALENKKSWKKVLDDDGSTKNTTLIIFDAAEIALRPRLSDLNDLVSNGPAYGVCTWIDGTGGNSPLNAYERQQREAQMDRLKGATDVQFSIRGKYIYPDAGTMTRQPFSTYAQLGKIKTLVLDERSQNEYLEKLKAQCKKNLAENQDTDYIEVEIGKQGGIPFFLRLGPGTRVYHGLLSGKSGGGKTIFLKHLLASICEKYDESKVRIHLYDFKDGVNLNFFRGIPNFENLVRGESDPKKLLDALASFKKEAESRNKIFIEAQEDGFLGEGLSEYNDWAVKNSREALPVHILVIDEFARLYKGLGYDTKREINTELTDAARTARSQGMLILLVSQSFAGLEVMDSMKGQFQLRMSLQLDNLADCRAIFESGNASAYDELDSSGGD
jgi:hypothetical protein